MLTTTTGFELDTQLKQYRSYSRLFGFNWGIWHSLENVEQAEIWLSSESTTIRTLYRGGGVAYNSGQTKLKSITYDLILLTNDSEKTIAFEFLSYKIIR